MSLDPLTGLDPLQPAKTLTKTITYTFVPDAPQTLVTTPSNSTGTTGSSSGSVGYSSTTYYRIDPNTGVTTQITYEQFVAPLTVAQRAQLGFY